MEEEEIIIQKGKNMKQEAYFCPEDDITFSIQSFFRWKEKLKFRELNREWHRKVMNCYLDKNKDRYKIVFPFFLEKRENRSKNDFWYTLYDPQLLSCVETIELRIEHGLKHYDEMDMNLIVYPRTLRRLYKFFEKMPDGLLEILRQKKWTIRILNSYYHTPCLTSYLFKNMIIEKLYKLSIFH